jgi:chromosome segregation ATPase
MSTAGKVVTVFVTLLLLVWVCLLSMVARRNSNWGEKIQKQDESITRLTEELAKTRNDIVDLKNGLALEQEQINKDENVLRTEISKREGALTDVVESLERVKNQVTGQQAAENDSGAAKKLRTAEKEEAEKLLASAKSEVEDLKQSDASLRSEKEKLENEFKAVQNENLRLLQRVGR